MAVSVASAKSPSKPPVDGVAPIAISRLVLDIPKLERSPTLEDFTGMKPDAFAGKMAHAGKFIQANPTDGAPSSQDTDAYLGYDARNLYVIFICWDKEPHKVRARMTRRENAFDDDFVDILLDTFHDQRRGFLFLSNPLGIQADALFTEGNSEPDFSFDTVWYTKGKRTDQGYMVLFSIPFRSLRFSSADIQHWGSELRRDIPRNNESTYWPRVSSKIVGRLNQAGDLNGMEHISPGRNLQFIPYGIERTYRTLDDRGAVPRFSGEAISGDIGLDAKAVIKDSLVLDATLNPDFSQVESDEPQVTVNQRFEVFFPEKRPFFQENANFFSTPLNLVFTRRIVDPDYGVRLSGKLGRYAIGALFADDASPGKSVPRGDPLDGKKAYFGILRVARDFGKQNSFGMIFTERNFEGSYNRVGGVDTNLRWGKNWSGHAQALASSTRDLDGSEHNGPAYTAFLNRQDQKTQYSLRYTDVAEGFRTETGFFQRTDIRRLANLYSYHWRPEGKHLISYGPTFHTVEIWDHRGQMVDNLAESNFDFNFKRNTSFGFFSGYEQETLRPVDFPGLSTNRKYNENFYGLFFNTEFFKQVSLNVVTFFGPGVNFEHPSGVPAPGRGNGGNVTLTFKPIDKLQITNTYLLSRFIDPASNSGAFNSHILRSKWNYQINKELSLRVIGQYNSLLANPANSTLNPTKNFNADFLVTYLLNPGTAFYVGYNSNLSTLDPSLTQTANGFLQTRNQFINDGRVFFIKISYLFRL